ncbi:carboxylesterase/lipase family protein [Streptomyces sp. cmx-4-25]|uniref:carboxylesterase/lipase family protein n=1 Tax=Streptomyces sp. cmx-4-25 TaxID=2790933 RepID=UPI00398109CC
MYPRVFRPLRTALVTALLATVLAAGPGTAAAQGGEVITTASGQLQGTAPDANGVSAYRGIPYAAPPTGPLRWKSPQPVPRWGGIRQATTPGPACYGSNQPGAPAVPMSEDCLTLNIWSPPRGKQPKAVMVWLHGGGFQFGSGSDPKYDGAALAARGVLVVNVNYRLGAFGFLAHPDLDKEAGASGGYGLQDQIAALRWIQQNIASFGGNPGNVTLFGESAGAHAVGLLMSSPQAAGLFSKAIAQSGAFWDNQTGSIPTHTEALTQGKALAARLNTPTADGLRAIPATQLNTASTTGAPFGPSIDGQVLTDSPAAVFARGQQQRVPLLAGYTAAENFPIFDPFALPHATPTEFKAAAEKLFGAGRMPEFNTLYPSTTPAQTDASAEQLIGDMAITEQTWEMLGLHQRTSSRDVYAYKFTYTSPYSPVAAHVSDVPFVFGNLLPQYFAPTAPAATTADRAFSHTVMAYWTNFATRGNPNGTGLTTWPTYQGSGSNFMDLSATPAAVAEPDTARLRFIASFRDNGRFPAAWRTAGN